MKRRIAFIVTCFMLLSALCAPVSASEEQGAKGDFSSLVVLGDSISTGYKLPGTADTRASYANLLARALGLSRGAGYTNLAVDGYRSAEILKKARENEATVKAADLIVLSCGGNDVLRYMLQFAFEAAGGGTYENMYASLAKLNRMDAETVRAKLYSEKNEETIATALSDYRTNMETLVAYLREVNPTARILFLKQYNPTSGAANMETIDAYAEDILGRLNRVMEETVPAGGCELVDTYSVMTGNGETMSNILEGDIHPNALGHAKMFETICRYLNMEVKVPETTAGTTSSATAEGTTKPDTSATTEQVTSTEVTTATSSAASNEGDGKGDGGVNKTALIIGGVTAGTMALGVAAFAVGNSLGKKKK